MAFYGLEIKAIRNSYDPSSLTAIGEHIKKRRIQLHLFQRDVAKILDVSEDTITYWENGRATPQIQHYPKVIEFLGYNPFALDKESIGGQIYRYRTEQGISHKALSRVTGFNTRKLASWEKNLSAPNLEDRIKLVILDVLK